MVYCGIHKIVHRPEKLEKCLPIIVSYIENVGRVLRAAETIKKGQLAMFDKAFTIGNLIGLFTADARVRFSKARSLTCAIIS